MNPFHLWLGLPEKSANPNHYQLLGIKSSEHDAQAIERATKQRLARLSDVTPKPAEVEAFEKIRQRILKAQATLVDQSKRAQYDARLRAKLAQTKQKKAASASHPTDTEHPSAKIQVADQPPAPSPDQPMVAIPSEISGQAAPHIPMAVPVHSPSPPPLAESQRLSRDEISDSFSLTNASKDPDDLSIKKHKFRRRKNSWLVPIFCLILCLGGIGGLVYLVTNYESILGSRHSSTTAIVDPIESPRVAHEATVDDVPDKHAVDPTNNDPKVIPGNLSNDDPTREQPDKIPTPANIKFEKLDFDQLVQFRRHLENARRAMYRHDAPTAQNEIQNAQALFMRFERPDIALDPSQAPLQKVADAAGEIKSLLNGFWQQVISSTVAIPAGQPIKVAGKTLGFVEGTEQFVILRIDGRNVTYAYDFLPPGIAMALAEQGEKPDVPTFRMQQAAFYAVHSHLDPKYHDRAIEFANRAAGDGHDPQPIEDFVSFDTASVGVPVEKAPQPPAADIKSKFPELMVDLGIVDFRKMRPEQAANAVKSTLDAAMAAQNNVHKAISFEVAYMLAVKGGDIRRVMDVLDEYHVWFEYDYLERVEQALLDLAKQPLDERTARILLSAMGDEAETNQDEQYKKKLVAAGRKVASRHNLAELLIRLESVGN